MNRYSQGTEYHCLILRSDAQHRVSKDRPESLAQLAHAGALPRQARDALRGPFGAPQGEGQQAPQDEGELR